MITQFLLNCYNREKIENKHDALFCIFRAFMLEAGYVSSNKGLEDGSASSELKNLKMGGIYNFECFHQLCPSVPCTMTCIPMEPFFVAHGSFHNMKWEDQVHINLEVRRYINDMDGFNDVMKIYENVNELSVKFKDGFCHALLANVQESVNYHPVIGFSGILPDVKSQILSLLPVRDVVAMSAVNKEFKQVANSAALWKDLYKKDFGSEAEDSAHGSNANPWKQMYKSKYRLKKKRGKSNQFKASPVESGRPQRMPFIQYELLQGNRDRAPFIGFGLPGVERAALFPNHVPNAAALGQRLDPMYINLIGGEI